VEAALKHEWTTVVRSYELDMHRHVNNATYLQYLEAARMDFLNSIGFDYSDFFRKGYSLFVSKIEISYKSPAYLYDLIKVTTETVKKKRFSGTFRQTISRDQVILADAYVTWACVNKKGKPVPLPDEFNYPEFTPFNQSIPI